MKLTAPRRGTFWVAILLGALSIISHYGGIYIPIVTEGEFLLLALSLLILLLGCLLNQI